MAQNFRTTDPRTGDPRTIEAASVDLSGAARTLSIAAGATMLWRALGAPSLGPILLGLGGAALLWHGLGGSSPARDARPFPERDRARRRDPVHLASDDSFPASDPPSFTPTNGTVRGR